MKRIIVLLLIAGSSFAKADTNPSLEKMLSPLFVCGHDIPQDIETRKQQHKLRMLEQLTELEPDLTPKLVGLALTGDRISRRQLIFLVEILGLIKTGESELALDTLYNSASTISDHYYERSEASESQNTMDQANILSKHDLFTTKIRTTINKVRG